MGKWAIKSAGGPKKALLMGDGGVVRMLEYEAEKIRAAHNADIDRLTAELEEQRALCQELAFRARLVKAGEIVKNWPEWKKNTLAHTKPTNWREHIARLEAERDDLRAKLAAVLKMLEPGPAPCDCADTDRACPDWDSCAGSIWRHQRDTYARAKAIAEGTTCHDCKQPIDTKHPTVVRVDDGWLCHDCRCLRLAAQVRETWRPEG